MKRVFSLLLALVLAAALLPTANAVGLPARGSVSAAVSNPLYPDLPAPQAPLQPAAPGRPAEKNAVYKSVDEVALELLAAMEKRQAQLVVHLRYDTWEVDLDDLIDRACAETGIPTQGDSLRWVWNRCDATWDYWYMGSYYEIDLTLNMTYYTTLSQEAALTRKVDQVLDSFGFTSDTTDYQKVCTIYDYITDNVTYDYDNLNDPDHKLKYTAYAALCQGTAVCQGYAVLMYRMLMEENVSTRVVTGWSGESHAWNIVQLDGLYYNCDSTWDAGMSEYYYFLRCMANFPNHARNDYYTTPAFLSTYPMGPEDYTPPHIHTYGPWTVTEATCTLEGSQARTCSGCGETETEILPALGHDYISEVTAPTCTEPGFTTHTCSRCTDAYTDAPTESLGHQWNEGYVTIEPTENSAGLLLYICQVCSDHYEVDLQPHAHGYSESTVIEPGCTEPGFTRHSCPGCGHFYTDTYVEALGHDWNLDLCTRCGGERPSPFTDAVPAKFYYRPMLWALDNGITQGTGEGKFAPEDPCTRAQVVTFLWRAADSPAPNSTSHPFTDVKEGAYYYPAMLWAVEKGITVGVTDTTFGPGDPCNRGQVVTFLYRAMGTPAPESSRNPFTDVKEGAYYYPAMLWAVENGITVGVTDTTFGPGDPCNRGQVVTFLYRTFA